MLGTHVEQKGSLVTPHYLRFDFSHFQKTSAEELRQVERLVNERVRQDSPLQEYRDLPMEEAQKLGAIALFGEKYGDRVRVVKFADSVEFCGGCHVQSTGRIGFFRIVSESSIAAGVRRIEAITGRAAEESIYAEHDLLNALHAFYGNAKDLQAAVAKTIEENSGLQKQVEGFIKEQTLRMRDNLVKHAEERGGIRVVKAVISGEVKPDVAKDLAFQIAALLPDSVLVALGTRYADKPLLTVMLSKNLVEERGLNAGQMVREAARLIKGGGGGAPHFATAGGKDLSGLEAAVEQIVALAGI